jgi:hypothetical protein
VKVKLGFDVTCRMTGISVVSFADPITPFWSMGAFYPSGSLVVVVAMEGRGRWKVVSDDCTRRWKRRYKWTLEGNYE